MYSEADQRAYFKRNYRRIFSCSEEVYLPGHVPKTGIFGGERTHDQNPPKSTSEDDEKLLLFHALEQSMSYGHFENSVDQRNRSQISAFYPVSFLRQSMHAL